MPWTWLLEWEWALRPGFQGRVAIINAFYAAGGSVQKMVPLLFFEVARRDPLAAVLAGPPARYDQVRLNPKP